MEPNLHQMFHFKLTFNAQEVQSQQYKTKRDSSPHQIFVISKIQICSHRAKF